MALRNTNFYFISVNFAEHGSGGQIYRKQQARYIDQGHGVGGGGVFERYQVQQSSV